MNQNNRAADRQESLVLFDQYLPGIAAGSYRLITQQTIEFAKDGEQKHHYYRDQTFVVRGVRYFLGKDDIHSCFPPEGATGNFSDTLPHIVLRKRALPWERTISGRPWLALLLLSGQELGSSDGDASFRIVTPQCLFKRPARAPDGGPGEDDEAVLLPLLQEEDESQDTKLQVIDLPLQLFLDICPKLEDLQYLAHLRKVNTEDKAALGMHADGEFSVVLANRFPEQGANVALLVSLEGWESLLDGTRAVGNARKVRLVTLAHWRFADDSRKAYGFGELIKRLDMGTFAIRSPACDATEDRNDAVARLRRGFVPVEYRQHHGAQGFAWYRGPLAPTPSIPFDCGVFHHADAALAFDEATGTMDLSYAAAWQLGRLLALSSPTFTRGIRSFIPDYGGPLDAAERIERFLQLHRAAIVRDLQAARVDIPQSLRVLNLAEWLERLVRLHPLPFNYLVADERLLPAESLRFFHVDFNWVGALAAGAFSVAAVRAGKTDTVKQTHRQLCAAIARVASLYRRLVEGNAAETFLEGHFTHEPVSGFLLRSSVVADWPGLEVKVTMRGGASPPVLRLERLGGNVMLCMAHGLLEQVCFNEPFEGTRFGLVDGGAIVLQKVPPDTSKPSGQAAVLKNVRKHFSRGKVLDVAQLGAKLRNELAGGGQFGGAAFAMQLMRTAVSQPIEWKHV